MGFSLLSLTQILIIYKYVKPDYFHTILYVRLKLVKVGGKKITQVANVGKL